MSQQKKEADRKLRQEMLEYLKNQKEQSEKQMETLEIDTPTISIPCASAPPKLEDTQSAS